MVNQSGIGRPSSMTVLGLWNNSTPTLLNDPAKNNSRSARRCSSRWTSPMAGRPLRSQKPDGVLQELYALLIAPCAICVLMHEAALQAGMDPDRLSFVHAVHVLRDAILEFQMVDPAERPQLYARLLQDSAAGRLPAPRLRSNPRVVKRKMSTFRLKRPEHRHWPRPTMPFRAAVLLI
jgi:AhpD family alkylhydroperoxidase